jgi:hypothetical protein
LQSTEKTPRRNVISRKYSRYVSPKRSATTSTTTASTGSSQKKKKSASLISTPFKDFAKGKKRWIESSGFKAKKGSSGSKMSSPYFASRKVKTKERKSIQGKIRSELPEDLATVQDQSIQKIKRMSKAFDPVIDLQKEQEEKKEEQEQEEEEDTTIISPLDTSCDRTEETTLLSSFSCSSASYFIENEDYVVYKLMYGLNLMFTGSLDQAANGFNPFQSATDKDGLTGFLSTVTARFSTLHSFNSIIIEQVEKVSNSFEMKTEEEKLFEEKFYRIVRQFPEKNFFSKLNNQWKSLPFIYDRQMRLNIYFHNLCDLVYNEPESDKVPSTFIVRSKQIMKRLIQCFVRKYGN